MESVACDHSSAKASLNYTSKLMEGYSSVSLAAFCVGDKNFPVAYSPRFLLISYQSLISDNPVKRSILWFRAALWLIFFLMEGKITSGKKFFWNLRSTISSPLGYFATPGSSIEFQPWLDWTSIAKLMHITNAAQLIKCLNWALGNHEIIPVVAEKLWTGVMRIFQ